MFVKEGFLVIVRTMYCTKCASTDLFHCAQQALNFSSFVYLHSVLYCVEDQSVFYFKFAHHVLYRRGFELISS
jgi:hypothetical protein